MRHVTRSLAFALAGALTATGCATAHLKGEYAPGGQATCGERQGETEKHTVAEGHDWVFFWGIVELASSDLGDKAKGKMRPNEVLTDVEVRNHISLPGVLLWIVTAGLVSHHDLDLRGRIESIKPEKPSDRTTSMAPVDRTIIIGGAAGAGAGSERSERTSGTRFAKEDMFAMNTIDRPLADVSRDFNNAAVRAGLIPVSEINWNGLTTRERSDLRGEIPENKLEGVLLDNIRTFVVTNYALVNDVRKDPQCGTFVPGIVCYEKDGKTTVIYSRVANRLRQMDERGQVGEDKDLTRSQYEEHLGYATDYETSCRKLVEDLQKGSSSKTPSATPSGT